MCSSKTTKNNVLVIDDDETVLKNIQRKLRKSNPWVIELFPLYDPRQAIDKIRELRPTLVFLDFKMPNMTGIEVMENIRRLPGRIQPQVVLLSNVIEHRSEAIALGAVDYLVKADVPLGRIVEVMNRCISQANEKGSPAYAREELKTEDFVDILDDE